MSSESQNCEVSGDSRCQGTAPVNTPVARQWPSSHHVIAATDTHAMMEAMFSMRSEPRLYNENRQPLRKSPETAVKRGDVWCEMAASLRGRESRSTERPLLPSRGIKAVTESTTLCVTVIFKM
jgi:hypothetical protein